MKGISTILLKLNKNEIELLNGLYTITALKILASELSLKEINELIEKLTIT